MMRAHNSAVLQHMLALVQRFGPEGCSAARVAINLPAASAGKSQHQELN
jgi:hypothetical protein